MNEISPEFLERITQMEPELVEGGEGAFDSGDYEDDGEDGEDDAE